MKRVTASEARRNWFRLLDEVVSGEIVVIERKGRRVVLRQEPLRRRASPRDSPDYSALLSAPNADAADRWGWEWQGPGHDLEPRPDVES